MYLSFFWCFIVKKAPDLRQGLCVGNGNFSNDFVGSNTYNSPGNYTVELVAENNLGNCRDTFNIQLFIADSILSLNEIINEDIFINYNQNELKIYSTNNSLVNNQFQVYNEKKDLDSLMSVLGSIF